MPPANVLVPPRPVPHPLPPRSAPRIVSESGWSLPRPWSRAIIAAVTDHPAHATTDTDTTCAIEVSYRGPWWSWRRWAWFGFEAGELVDGGRAWTRKRAESAARVWYAEQRRASLLRTTRYEPP